MNRELATLSKRQHGLVHHRQFTELAISPGQIRSLCVQGGWVPLGQGVYRRTDLAQTLHQRLLAVTMQCGPTASLSHASAAWLWGLVGHSAYAPIHVRSDRTATSRQPAGVALHRGASLPRRWVTEHLGIPVVRPEVVALQLLTSQFGGGDTAAAADVDTMWSLRLLTPDSIACCLAELGTRGRRGVGAVRRYLDERPDGNAHPTSPLEQRITDLVAATGRGVERLAAANHELPCGRIELGCGEAGVLIRVHNERYRAALEVRGSVERAGAGRALNRRSMDVRASGARGGGSHRGGEDDSARSTRTDDTIIEFTDAEVWKRPRHVTAKVTAAFDVQRVSAEPRPGRLPAM